MVSFVIEYQIKVMSVPNYDHYFTIEYILSFMKSLADGDSGKQSRFIDS